MKELSLAVAAVSEQLTASLDRMPTVDEIGGAGGWVRPEVDEAMRVGTTHRLNDRETLESVHVAEMFGVNDDVSE